ncbi:hypothetical protein BC941DRAFT_508247 [Chlamydoabsidia padenii]|nr:hypothetical protein BC941DRAFT_508247 [Chlamydoabsidia padenii]
MNYIKKTQTTRPFMQPKYTSIFSDDEEEDSTCSFSSSLPTVIPSLQTQRTSFPPHYIDPVQTSSSYHIHQAEMALFNLKSAVLDDHGAWKKVLEHKKSGVAIRMKTSTDKATMFKGEVIFQGFTPHSIFYVIGMRKLWDELYEDGNLVENLNDTTSLTYEVCKQTSKSRRDLCLVEKIECTQNGTILFACTSAETPKVPRLQNRTRAQIKLMGWVLEPLSSDSIPLTKVSFVIQEPMKGWMSGLTKKSLARRPLIVLTSVYNYMKAKDQRVSEQRWCHPIRKRPSVLTNSTLSSQKLSNNDTTTNYGNKTKSSTCNDSEHQQTTTTIRKPLYSPHRHLSARNDSVHLLKQLYLSPVDEWQLKSTTHDTHSYIKEYQGLVYSRLDGTLQGDWLPEQVCSMLLSVHVRKHWDDWWKRGSIVERFSQRDYLMHWVLAGALQQDLAVFTHIDSEHGGRRIFMASKSIEDDKIPRQDGYQRTTMALYGWVFSIKSSSSGTTELGISFIVDSSLSSLSSSYSQLNCLTNLQYYLSHHGCPPYIRRVCGKIVMEYFGKAANYQVAWIVRHQPPQHQHQQKNQLDWCTEIRIDPFMYRHGYVIDITPTQGTRIDRNRRTIRVFTTDSRMEGATIHIKISHQIATPKRRTLSLQSLASYNSIHELSLVNRSPNQKQHVTQPIHCVPLPPAHSTNNNIHQYTPPHVPKGYILVPQLHNRNQQQQQPLLNFTDDLTFNGQQLMVILFGMMIHATDFSTLTTVEPGPMSTDALFSAWMVFSKNKNSLENAKRLENLSWRLWYRESFHQHHQQEETTTTMSTQLVPVITSSLSSHSTFGPQTPLEPNTQQHKQQQQQRRTNKFYVDESDDDDDDDDDDEQNESLWSTLHDDHYFEEAYQQQQSNLTPCLPPQGLLKKEVPSPLPLPLTNTTNQKQSCSLLSRLIQSSPPQTSQQQQQQQQQQSEPCDLLPPQLQSCVDWEKSQNSIRYRLGYSLDLPDENIIW